MKKTKMTPELRFKGFEEEWEEKKVSEILVERNIQAPKSEEYPLMAFIAYEGVTKKGDRYNREFLVNDEKNKRYKHTEFGDFIYSSNNLETGSIGLNNYGKASISPVYSIFQPTKYGNSNFIGRLMIREYFINQMIRWRQGVIYGQWRIHESDFLQIVANTPSVEEQSQIGSFFQELDAMIALHQRKHDKLFAVKKAMLEKMFPQEGTNVPEIRIKGFARKWDRKKISDIFKVTRGYVLAAPETSEKKTKENSYPVYSSQTKENGLMGYYKKYLYTNAITWTTDGANAGTVNFRNGKFYCTNVCGVLLSNEGYANKMVAESLNKIAWKHVSKVGNPKLMNNVMSEIVIVLPEDIEEQNKIAAFFQCLDSLISLHQRELDKLKNIKKACLEKMFV